MSLLGVASAGWACCRRHTKGHLRRNGAARNREKRVTQRWLDEYENRPEYDAQACPKGGLECSCIQLPEECPHLDWGYWDNDYRRPAIGELFDITPSWTLDSLQVNKTTLRWNR